MLTRKFCFLKFASTFTSTNKKAMTFHMDDVDLYTQILMAHEQNIIDQQ